MKVNIITIGDEILIGQTIDTNSAWMGQYLNEMGAQIHSILSIRDELEEIKEAIQRSFESADVVLMTGGLGPTKDDVTKKAIADYFNVEMTFHQPTYDRILRLFEKWGRKSTEAHRLQCFMPANADLLHNKMGTAPGMWFDYNGKVLVSMPGVPYEMKYLVENQVAKRLVKQFPLSPIVHKVIQTVGEGESRIAKRIEHIEEGLPPHIKLAYLPNLGRVRLRLTATGADKATLEKEIEPHFLAIKEAIPELIFGEGAINLETAIGKLLLKSNLTLGTAESCTGGYIAHMLTSISGSSRYYHGSIVAYDNSIKTNVLKVKPETLETHGAVSEQTVIEMAKGAVDLLNTDLAVAVSGIAGPGGGTEEKPVGTVWMAVSDGERSQTRLIRAGKDRVKNIQYASVYALNLVRQFVSKIEVMP